MVLFIKYQYLRNRQHLSFGSRLSRSPFYTTQNESRTTSRQLILVVRVTRAEHSRRFLRELDEAPGGNNLQYIY